MEVSFLLLKQIVSLFLIIGMGILLVRSNLLTKADTKGISVTTLYLIIPCVIIHAFQVDFTPEVRDGLILSFVCATVMHIILLAGTALFGKLFHLDAVEKASIIYSNAGNLIIPIVTALFGPEWIIYSCGFMFVQILLLWSHGRMLLCGEKRLDLKKLLLNVNLISATIGLLLFSFRIQLPALIDDAMASVGSMIGPLSMIVTGILIGSMTLKQLMAYHRVILTSCLRLLILPALILLVIKLTGMESFHPEGHTIILIGFLAAIAPSASSITQMALVYGKDAEYASVINVVTTLACIVTMPVMVMVF